MDNRDIQVMASNNNNSLDGGSPKLKALAQQLRLCKQQQEDGGQQNVGTRSTSSQDLDFIAESAENPNRAAVLVCLFEGNDGDLHVILTKRSSTLSSHSGEVALPGGKRDDGDADDVATALREANEEIGLDPSIVDVVTVLEPFVNKRGLIVVPVLGILYNKGLFNPIPNAAEVESIFNAPLEMFLKDENRREEEREWMGNKYLLHFFDFEADNKNYVIWALTAGILIKVASIVYQRPPAFLEQRPKFWSRTIDKNAHKL